MTKTDLIHTLTNANWRNHCRWRVKQSSGRHHRKKRNSRMYVARRFPAENKNLSIAQSRVDIIDMMHDVADESFLAIQDEYND